MNICYMVCTAICNHLVRKKYRLQIHTGICIKSRLTTSALLGALKAEIKILLWSRRNGLRQSFSAGFSTLY